LQNVPRRDIDFVLFDLGGVLIELGGIAMLQELAGIASDEEVWARWLACPWVRKFEKGKCSATELSVGVVSEWHLDISPERFLEVFRDWPIGPYPGARDLLEEVQRSVPIGCLSNTNSLHWEHQSVAWPMLGMFDVTFLSFELGLVKPDAEIFQAVADQLQVDRQRVLYLDDVALNADAARNFGFRSEQVGGPDECRTVLRKFGLPTQ
jgi:putative hydrolase of the HAD superfamily